MRQALVAEASEHGFVTRRRALALAAEHVVDDAVRDGVLEAVWPSVYSLPGLAADLRIRRLAALAYQSHSALSHTDGLDVWSLPSGPAPSDGSLPDVHVTIPASSPHVKQPGLVVHRRQGFRRGAPLTVVRQGLAVVRLEQAIVESWLLLPDIDRRVPAIVALRRRRTTGSRLLATLAANGRTTGAAEMRHVFGLAAAGCHSPLEMWGHEHVFSHPSLPASRCQVPVRLPTGLVYLDRLYDAEMVNVELDGAAYHGEPGQREADIRRDAALARLGYLTVRLSHPRLHRDPDDARTEMLGILAMRRRQLGIRAAS